MPIQFHTPVWRTTRPAAGLKTRLTAGLTAGLKAATVFGLCVAGLAPAHAQSWPTKPIKIVLPYTPGGSVDSSTRMIMEPVGMSAQGGTPAQFQTLIERDTKTYAAIAKQANITLDR